MLNKFIIQSIVKFSYRIKLNLKFHIFRNLTFLVRFFSIPMQKEKEDKFPETTCILRRSSTSQAKENKWNVILFFDTLPVGVSPYLQKSWQAVFDLVDIPHPYKASIKAV